MAAEAKQRAKDLINQTEAINGDYEENFIAEFKENEEETELHEVDAHKEDLKTHTKIKKSFVELSSLLSKVTQRQHFKQQMT